MQFSIYKNILTIFSVKKGTLPLHWVSSPGLDTQRSGSVPFFTEKIVKKCEMCPGTAKLKENLRNAFNEHGIDEVRFEIWLQTDRCILQTLVMDTDEFLDDFCKTLLKLKTHHFISEFS